MEKALQKFIKKMLLEKYPMYLDVHVIERMGKDVGAYSRSDCYEILPVILSKDFNLNINHEVTDFIYNLAKYMNVKICGVYNDVVEEDEWEEMKNNKEG